MSRVYEFLSGYPSHPSEVLVLRDGEIELWDEVVIGRPAPDQAERDLAETDGVEVNGQVYSEWLAEHGGDVDLTRRRKAKELLDKIDQQNQLLRAIVIAVNARANQIATKTNAILDAIDAASSLSQLKTTVAGINDLPVIQKTALRTEIYSHVTSGESDGELSG